MQGNLLLRKFRSCSEPVKHALFKAYCSNAYCSQLWTNYRRDAYKKCTVAYNDIYRNLFSLQHGTSISNIYVQNQVNSFNVVVRKNVYSFIKRLSESENFIISTIMQSAFYHFNSSLRLKWTSLLYV